MSIPNILILFLDGQASVGRLVDKAMKNGMKGIAVTDHGNMFGIKKFQKTFLIL